MSVYLLVTPHFYYNLIMNNYFCYFFIFYYVYTIYFINIIIIINQYNQIQPYIIQYYLYDNVNINYS